MFDSTRESRLPTASFWLGKRVLITGHTGFKGAWLSLWLKRLGASVYGVGLPPVTHPNLFSEIDSKSLWEVTQVLDIRHAQEFSDTVSLINPHIVFHLAAQSLVGEGYRHPLETFETNVQGTVNVLDGVLNCSACRVVVAVTTDKVYELDTHERSPLTESDCLGGRDPYSASKAACEHVIRCYRDSFYQAKGIALASARAGNVIGGGDWAVDRLLPDAVRTWSDSRPLLLRSPDSTRPWQHVLEPLCGYLVLAESLWHQPELAGPYNFGPAAADCVSVRQVINKALAYFENASVEIAALKPTMYESPWIELDNTKSAESLGVTPKWSVTDAIDATMKWYKSYLAGVSAASLCHQDIDRFEQYQGDQNGSACC